MRTVVVARKRLSDRAYSELFAVRCLFFDKETEKYCSFRAEGSYEYTVAMGIAHTHDKERYPLERRANWGKLSKSATFNIRFNRENVK